MSKPRVLLVEDDSMLRTVLRLVLEHLELECTSVDDGVCGLEQICSEAYALVVTDVRMPRMSGMEMIVAARRRAIPLPKVIMLSGYHDHSAAELHDAGVDLVLHKPVSLDELREHVTKLLARSN